MFTTAPPQVVVEYLNSIHQAAQASGGENSGAQVSSSGAAAVAVAAAAAAAAAAPELAAEVCAQSLSLESTAEVVPVVNAASS